MNCTTVTFHNCKQTADKYKNMS